MSEQLTLNNENMDTFLNLAATVGQGLPAARLVEYKKQHNPGGNPRYWAIVDFNRPSTEKRFYVFDTKDGLVERYYVAHGRGSDPDHNAMADIFSNEPHSNCSSLGIYKCRETYHGTHGLALRLDGREPTNSKARARDIVLHKADYVSEEFIGLHQKLGRSRGCFAVENGVRDRLVDHLKNGSFLIAWKS